MARKSTYTAIISLLLLVLVPAAGAAPGRSVNSSAASITIDPGHGGYDPGATVEGVTEKNVNLAIARRLKALGNEHPTIDFVLTRTSDNYLPLLDRLEVAESRGRDGYLSIHATSFSDPGVTGVEIILDRSRSKAGKSWDMAELVQDAVVDRTGAGDRGIRYQRLYTRHTSVPAVLLEVGFLTSPVEREKLISQDYQDDIAKGIIQGLLRYFSRN